MTSILLAVCSGKKHVVVCPCIAMGRKRYLLSMIKKKKIDGCMSFFFFFYYKGYKLLSAKGVYLVVINNSSKSTVTQTPVFARLNVNQ